LRGERRRKYAYNAADEMSEVRMLKETETPASLVYTCDSDGQLKGAASAGRPGEQNLPANATPTTA